MNRSPLDIVTPFADTLRQHGLALCKGDVAILQVNVGYLCDLSCRHCHLEAGPHRPEVMAPETMAQVVALARRHPFPQIDVTGGAPELVPGMEGLVRRLAPLTGEFLFRSNLTALGRPEAEPLRRALLECRAVIVASLPATNLSQVEAQRGGGVFDRSLGTLQLLNAMGYGMPGSGLRLQLAVNPSGAFLPPDQCATERRFRQELELRFGIRFSGAHTFANVPLGRFRTWLEQSGNLEPYLRKLADAFNPSTVDGLMCRTTLSVAWDGRIYDCDFNLAAGQGTGGQPLRIDDLPADLAGMEIPTGDYCYACTAGAGFS
jgi:radical SAM/Cys-rich protein